jgi:hypothetical protein
MSWETNIGYALEIVAVVLVAGYCLYWGQRLFQNSVVGPVDNKPGSAKPQLLYAKLLPALLFAVFGAAMLFYVTANAIVPQHASPVAAQVEAPARS